MLKFLILLLSLFFFDHKLIAQEFDYIKKIQGKENSILFYQIKTQKEINLNDHLFSLLNDKNERFDASYRFFIIKEDSDICSLNSKKPCVIIALKLKNSFLDTLRLQKFSIVFFNNKIKLAEYNYQPMKTTKIDVKKYQDLLPTQLDLGSL